MSEKNNHKSYYISLLKDESLRLFFISFGVFLFILFFQPFPLESLDYNNRLLYVTGFGGISFLLQFLILVLIPLLFPDRLKRTEHENFSAYVLGFIFITVTGVAFAFYIRYVGNTILTLYVLFKIFLVCLFPLIILMILHKNKFLVQIIEVLNEKNKLYLSKLGEYEKITDEEEIEISSTNKSEQLILKYKHIISVKSADNYIDVTFFKNNEVESKLLRSTLKNIETQLADRSYFIKCHRTAIVNVMYVEKIVRSSGGYSLKMSCFEENIPISRQYFIPVKEAVSFYS
jgi:hypothetical protein